MKNMDSEPSPLSGPLVKRQALEVEVEPPSKLPPILKPGEPEIKALPHGISRQRLMIAFAIAGISDALSMATDLIPPLQWGVDVTTALSLFAVLGWHWIILPGLIMEAIPGIAMFPFWLLVVSAVAVWGTARPSVR